MNIIYRILLAMIILSPLPFGGHRPWVWGSVALVTAGLLLAWSVRAARTPDFRLLPSGIMLPLAIPFALALIWGIGQASGIAGPAHPLWTEAAAALPGFPVSGHISLDPAASWAAIMRLLSLAGVFWLTVHLTRNPQRAETGMRMVVLACTAYACYGLLMHFAGLELILWYRKDAYLGDVTGTFVNRNAFGAFVGLGMLASMAMAVEAVNMSGRSQGGLRHMAELLLVRGGGYLVCFMIMATALMLSHSRGAFLSTVSASLLLIVLFVLGGVLRYRAAAMAMLVLMACGGAAMVTSADVTMDRLMETTDHHGDRAHLYELSIAAIADAPLTGHGLGAFASSFRIYRDTNLPRPVIYDFAHNVYLETLLDLGVIAGAALILPVVIAAVRCAIAVRTRRRRQFYPAVAASAAVLIGLHSLVDFSIQMLGVALLFTFMLGIGVAQSWGTSRDQDMHGAQNEDGTE